MRKSGKGYSNQRELNLGGGRSIAPRPINRLNISDIYFGSIDAADELDVGDQQDADNFYDTFYMPTGLHADRYISGHMFLVYGLKGTGKTSFLRYLSEKIRREAVSPIRPDFFQFSKEFPKEIYDDLRMAYLGNRLEVEENRSDIYRDIDYEDVWLFILLKRIVELTSGRGAANTPSVERFKSFMSAISPQESRDRILRFLPNIKSGQVTLGTNIDPEIDIEFDDMGQRRMTFHRYVEQALDLYGKAAFETDPVYILLDEIDPRTASGVLFELDCILIRDLVVALRRLNTVSRAGGKKIYLIAAVRSEILTRVESLGKEIHKRFEQFGFCMNWGDLGKTSIEHPLIKMICKKIAYSERKKGILAPELGQIEEQIWPRYFRKNKTDQMDPKYFLDWTWLRPRDCIRLFDVCKEADGETHEISESLINRVQKRYSKRSWVEISTHLTLFMDPFCLEGLNKVMVGFAREFSLSEFEARLGEIAMVDNYAERLARKHKPAEIISLLYSAGAVGNIQGTKLRFHHRGDDSMSLTSNFYLHRALLPHFSISRG